ncbi:ferredoxin [Paraclostridium sordellii]|uniref:Ferredoxin n=1 Tax=Paraclostridium sordellii TaxID=1505 RepID=A0A0C7Q402_PARSO|nr:ferredoxin [Paeniclostridium sordellii]QYE99293.1 ferredoxin [Paeniclostridium sordellii]CEN78094.1 ferredoxin [[Clostridium] sordellii] [Paeniclostridium sordellii]CEO07468.1 ferredoxin [[Clostridium] sordellii] [Paeniclostridium sordellii]CEP86898.1 ferredoxin [[Clostridium] sordellii] [Paeniclostridium sordellii]CEP97776.1 ferredoxin [[Clostridium] sordellii] [Paeniclostridium sordellii]
MKAFVDKDVCIGCGACTGICPEIFEMEDDGLAIAKEGAIPAELEESAVEAQDGCPVSAITVE